MDHLDSFGIILRNMFYVYLCVCAAVMHNKGASGVSSD